MEELRLTLEYETYALEQICKGVKMSEDRLRHDEEYIRKYTTHEGGPWLWFPIYIRVDNILNEQLKEAQGKVIENRTFIRNVQLHSFQTSRGREWDVINGWRKKVLDIKPEPPQDVG